MTNQKRLVLDANILPRAVFGVRVRSLLETYEGSVSFFAPDICLAYKGLVKREEVGKAHLYQAARSEQETQRQFIGDIRERLFGGSAGQLVLQALSSESVGADELAQIKLLISQKEREL